MNLIKFYEHQGKNISHIILDPKISDSKISTRKYLMLNVKLGNLANETQCFKYWIDTEFKLKRDGILNKYIDCLAHILTIGMDKKYDDISEVSIEPNDCCLSDQFLTLYVDINDMMVSCSKDHFKTLLEDFLSLGHSLGFTDSQIEEAFFKENSLYETAL